MKNIVVIGAGQLGSRHLQALALCTFPVTLHVVDPNKESLETAKERFEEIKPNKNIREVKYYLSLDSLDSEIDFCVIATGANARLTVLQALAERVKVKYLLLEKVLFQTIADYHHARKILEKHEITAWVNCPRRMYSIYQELKMLLDFDSTISCSVAGGEWGLGCNAIHFLDLMTFLTDSIVTRIDNSEIDKILHESKRLGFVEFTGCLRALFENSSELELVSTFKSEDPLKVLIETDTFEVVVLESEGKATVENKMTGNVKDMTFELPYQSSLTNLIAEDILFKQECQLTTFDESVKLHMPLIESLLAHVNQVTGESDNLLKIT